VALQQVEQLLAGYTVLVGGGRDMFEASSRADHVDLLAQLQKAGGVAVATNRTALHSALQNHS
jgi:alkaline phosphatase